MSNIYIANGERYEVDDYNLDKFFEEFPNATKLEEPKTQPQEEQKLPEDKGWFEDMLTAIRGGSAAGSSVGESFDVYRQGRNISDEDLQDFIKAAQAIENNPETNEAASWRKDTKKHIDAEIASETKRINTLAADPMNMYTEGDRTGHIKRVTKDIKNQYRFSRVRNYFDFNKRQSTTTSVPGDSGSIDIFSSQASSEVLQDFAKKKKKKYID